ncbi:MAG: NAD(P) transhydrogenase subunit alpha [Alphaproteobacteria bacterium]|nr:NAD(P) transhydrogenase subunit alpha [Alphaproteobacteria bacterium]
MTTLFLISIFVLSCLIGVLIAKDVTPALHSPLMSVSNAISGIVIIGALSSAAYANGFNTQEIISLFGVFFASLNIFGGFVISWRMLRLFKKRKEK